MTKENGILERIYKQKRLSGDIDKIKLAYRQNPVTPANAQALVEGLLGHTGLSEPMAAKYANSIGNKGFAAGNGLIYGMSYGDPSKGHYVFTDLTADASGRLQTSRDRKSAITAKFSNMESQEKMRKIHRNNFMIEDMDGNAIGLHEEGKSFLKSLTGHDLGQISRLRTDLINHAGRSDEVLREMKDFADELATQGDKDQARIVKIFAGYIKSKVAGRGVKEEDEAMKNYDSKTQGVNAWHDSFNKYIRLDQYKGWKKSDRQITEDSDKANKLAYRNERMMNRMSSLDIKHDKQRNKGLAYIEKNKEQIREDYMKKGGYSAEEAEKQINLDRLSYTKHSDEDKAKIKEDYEKEIKGNSAEESKLRDPIIKSFIGGFDPGSERTLAACLIHASRARKFPSGSE